MECKKHETPAFLKARKVKQEDYEKWLRRHAQAHVKRDRRRGNKAALDEPYRQAIHAAVLESEGRDANTGEDLDWGLLSKFDNQGAKKHGRHFKQKFALLPTVDHVADDKSPPLFKICAWRTNDMKNDLDSPQLTAVCRRFLEYQGYIVSADG
jgi:hypothetical protein